MSKLLINEHPLQVLPSLAEHIGLNEAIIIQQLHYWLNNTKIGKVVDGRKWMYNSVDSWGENFPFWSSNTIRRALGKLAKMGLIETRTDLNTAGFDRTKWYAINYAKLDDIEREIEAKHDPQDEDQFPPFGKNDKPSTQNGQTNNPKWANDIPNLGNTIPETTTETTTDNIVADATPPEPPAKKSKPKPKQPTEYQSMFEAIATVTVTDLTTASRGAKANIGRLAKRLVKAGKVPSDVTLFERWWYANDWRGQKKQPPTVKQMADGWGQAFQAQAKPTNKAEADYLDLVARGWDDNAARVMSGWQKTGG